MTKRRDLILSSVAAMSPIIVRANGGVTAAMNGKTEGPSYGGYLQRIHEGPLQKADVAAQVHANFAPLIEQNFSTLNQSAANTLFDAMSDAEFSDMAQLYVNAIADHALRPNLLRVLVRQLNGLKLRRLAKHFGRAQVINAISQAAPEKRAGFLKLPQVDYAGPAVGEMKFGPQGRYDFSGEVRASAGRGALLPRLTAATISKRSSRAELSHLAYSPTQPRAAGVQTVAYGQFLNHTPYEVYLSFRTAPLVASLGVAGALWETSFVLSGTLLPAFSTGYAIGTIVVKPLIETYAPSLYIAIGDTIGSIASTMSNSWSGSTTTIADAQRSTSSSFLLSQPVRDVLQSTGGDFGSAFEWCSVYGGGLGCWTCPSYDPK